VGWKGGFKYRQFTSLLWILFSAISPHVSCASTWPCTEPRTSGQLGAFWSLACVQSSVHLHLCPYMPQTTEDMSGSPKSILASSFPDLSVTFLPSLSLPPTRTAKAQASCTAGFPCLFAIKIMFVSSKHSGLCEHHLKCSQVLLNKGDQSGVCCQMILRLYRLPTVYLPK
jgi:hypothetical protein